MPKTESNPYPHLNQQMPFSEKANAYASANKPKTQEEFLKQQNFEYHQNLIRKDEYKDYELRHQKNKKEIINNGKIYFYKANEK